MVRVSWAYICIIIGSRCNIIYASKLLNKVEYNYITTEREVLIMVYVMHKLGRTHMVVDVLSRLLDSLKPLGVPN